MILMSSITTLLFLGGWSLTTFNNIFTSSFIFGLKIFLIMNFFVIVRASYPRMRYDQLMEFCWKGVLPLTLSWFLFTLILIRILNAAPSVGGPLFSFDLFNVNFNNINNLNIININTIDYSEFFDILSEKGDWWTYKILKQIMVPTPFFEYFYWMYPIFYNSIGAFNYQYIKNKYMNTIKPG